MFPQLSKDKLDLILILRQGLESMNILYHIWTIYVYIYDIYMWYIYITYEPTSIWSNDICICRYTKYSDPYGLVEK